MFQTDASCLFGLIFFCLGRKTEGLDLLLILLLMPRPERKHSFMLDVANVAVDNDLLNFV